MKIAAIDIGSNSIHLIIANVHADGSYTVVDKAKEMVGLASDTLPNGDLAETAMLRGLECMQRFQKMIELQGVDAVDAVATSAVREATNGQAFIDRLREECSIEARIIPGVEEARLIYLGARDHIDWTGRRALIVDIGGGSVEFIVADRERAHFFVSLKLGVRRLSEEFLHSDPPTSEQLGALRAHIRTVMRDLVPELRDHAYDFVVGSSGTLNTLAEMTSAMNRAPVRHSHGVWVDLSSLNRLAAQLLPLDFEGRLKIPKLQAKRVDTINAGAVLAQEILRAVGRSRYVSCDYALRDGVVVQHIQDHGPGQRIDQQDPDLRRRSVHSLFRRFNQNGPHPRQVANLALSLFDQLQPLHNLDASEREILEAASMLHDIGDAINARKRHRHSAYLIRNGDLYGFSSDEIDRIAMVARYNRGSAPQSSHEPFSKASPEHKHSILSLSSILRLANALDRSRTNNTTSIQCTLSETSVHLDVVTRTDPDIELWGLDSSKDLFEHHFEREVTYTHTTTTYPKHSWLV